MKTRILLISILFLLVCVGVVTATTIPYSIESGTNSMWVKTSLNAGVTQQVFVNQTNGYTPNPDNVFLLSDTFNSLNASKWSTWTNGSAAAIFSSGNLVLSGPSGGTNWVVLKSLSTFNPVNKTIEFSVNENTVDYQSMLGLATGNTSYSMSSNYLGLQLQNNSDYSAVPKLYSSTAITPLGSSDLPNVQYKYTIKYIPGNASVYANDIPLLTGQAITINAGSGYSAYITEVSPYNAANTLTVDWFRIRDALPVEPTVTLSGYSMINGVNYSVYNITSPVTIQNYAVNLSSVGAVSETESFDVETGLIPPVASFSNNVSNIGIGGSVQFTDASFNNPTSWLWDFGDGSNSTQQNPTHTYNTLGTFTVKLTAINMYGSNNFIQSNLITTAYNGRIGDLTLTDIRGNTLSDVPNSVFAAAKGTAVVCNVSVGFNSSLQCIDYTKTYGQLGEIYFTKFNPAVETNYSFDLGLDGSNQNNQFYLYTALSFIELQKYSDGHYVLFSPWTADNGTVMSPSVTIPASGIVSNQIHLSIENNDTTRYNTVTANGYILTTPYRLQLSRDLPYSTVVTPVLFGESYISDVGGYLDTHIYNVTQTIRRNTITTYAPTNYQAFGLDWQCTNDAQNGTNYMANNKQVGTIWQDPSYTDAGHTNFTNSLLASGWEPGIHFSQSLTTLTEAQAEAVIDNNMTLYYNLYGVYPTSWCSLANSDNVTQAIYVYNKYGALWRNGNSGVTWINNVGNLENGTYPCFWLDFINHGATYPMFTHQTDYAIAPSSFSIDWDKFKTFSDGYKSNNVNIVGFAQYYNMSLSQKHAVISNVSNTGSLTLTVNSNTYPINVNVKTTIFPAKVFKNNSYVNSIATSDGVQFIATNGVYTISSIQINNFQAITATSQTVSSIIIVFGLFCILPIILVIGGIIGSFRTKKYATTVELCMTAIVVFITIIIGVVILIQFSGV